MDSSVITDPITRLRFVLAVNATTSGLAGLTALTASGRVDRWLDTGHPAWVRVVGAGLVVFAVAVVALARSDEQHLRPRAPAVSVADGAWVVASVATITAGWYSTSGAVLVGIIAAVVGTFAIAQMRLSRTLRESASSGKGAIGPVASIPS